MEAESLLLGALGKDYGDGVFKYLAPRAIRRHPALKYRNLKVAGRSFNEV